MKRGTMLAVLSLAAAVVAWVPGTAETRRQLVEPKMILKENRVEPTWPAIEAYFRSLILVDDQQKRIAALITQLGSEDFDEREKASATLEEIGPSAVEALRRELRNPDAEVLKRTTDLLAILDKPGAQAKRDLVTDAALKWVTLEKPEGSAALLLDVLPFLTTPALKELATLSLWTTATPADAERLRRAVARGPAGVRASALPVLERVDGARAEAIIAGFLKDPDAATRLAAARAMLDRRPKEATDVLAALLDDDDVDVRLQAGRLLQLASGFPAEGEGGDLAELTTRWKKWVATKDAERPRVVGMARFTLERYGLLLTEQFTRDAISLADGYDLFRYEAKTGGSGSVSRGRLRLVGTQVESDQRLYVTSEKMVHRATMPQNFQVRAAIGGEGEMSGGWHVGVALGNVRVLFHPATQGGAFRVERVDTHVVFVPNETMTFTPEANVLHDMTLDVQQKADGTVTINIKVEDGKKTGLVFRKSVTIPKNAFGPLDRISLERSGRQGGAALFGCLSIRN